MLSKNLAKRALCSLTQSSKCVVLVRRHGVWTADNVIRSPFQPIVAPNCTVNEYIWHNLDKWPERTASVCSVTGRGYTYEQAFKLSHAFAANLRKKLKVQDGDTVAILLPNIPDYPLVAMGVLQAGGVITSINPVYTADEIQRQLVMSDTKVIVTLPENVNTVRKAMNMAKLKLPIIVVKTNGKPTPDDTILFNELSEDTNADVFCLRAVRRSPDDVCFLPYSSGTTGLPKGVELTHKNILANCLQINEPLVKCHTETTASHQDAVMTILPLYHSYAATVIMFDKMSLGVKMVTLDKFQPDNFLTAMKKYKTNVLFAAPPIVLMMATHPNATPESYRYLDTIMCGAAPLAATDVDRFFEKARRKLDFRQGYGLTETSPVLTMSQKGDYGRVGNLLPSTEMKIVNSEMNSLGPDEKGEILVRGPQVMKGYNKNDKANSEVFTPDGWFRTGDMATVDTDGVVTIADRVKELIKVKGFQVPPAELEAVLRDHPSIDDAAVIGVPHDVTGEVPKAFVVAKNKVDVKDICEFVNAKVAPYKRISDVVFLDAIPKSAAGKILRKDLKSQYC